MISICATCFNHERFIPDFVESVRAQTVGDWELNVVDDCSTDGSFALLREYAAKDSRIRVAQNDRNRHVCHSGNRAASMATGELVTLMSCDDMLIPGKVEYDQRFFDEHPDIAALYTNPLVCGEALKKDWLPRMPEDFSRHNLLRTLLFGKNCLCVVGLTMRKAAWDAVGGYHPLLRMTQDYELHVRLLENYNVAKADVETIRYRVHGANLSKRTERFENAVANENAFFLADHYLGGIKSVGDLEAIVPECVAYGKPTAATIPYFLSRYAIEHGEEASVRFAGLMALYHFMCDRNNCRTLEETCGFLEKDFMSLAELPALGAARELLKAQEALRLTEQSASYRLGLLATAPLRAAWRMFKGGGS